MWQTQVNNQILFALPPSAQLSMLDSDSLRCFCPFLIFLARWIPAQTHWSVPRRQLIMLTKFIASHMICAPGYCHNDITVLNTGKPNSYLNRGYKVMIIICVEWTEPSRPVWKRIHGEFDGWWKWFPVAREPHLMNYATHGLGCSLVHLFNNALCLRNVCPIEMSLGPYNR